MRAINIEISYDGIFRRTPYVRQGENGTTTLYLVLPTDYQGYKYVIVFQPVTGDPISTVELTPDSNHIISYVLTSVFTAEVGTIGVELNCYDESDNLVKSAEMSIEVKESLTGAGDVMPTDYVPWYVLTAEKATEATLDRIATAEDRAAVTGAASDFTTVTVPAAIQSVTGEGDTQVGRVTAEGDTQEQRVTDEGNTQVQRVQDEFPATVEELNDRIDNIITTPISGEAAAQELVDARGGKATLGDRLSGINTDVSDNAAKINDLLVNERIYPTGANSQSTLPVLVSFVDDDGASNTYSLLAPVFNAKGKKFTTAVVTNFIGDAGYMTAEQILELHNAGHEIASHSHTHRQLATIAVSELDYECYHSQEILEGITGEKPASFVYPGGSENESVTAVVRKYYKCARSTTLGVNVPPVETFRHLGNAIDELTLGDCTAKVDAAITSGGWLIFYSHSYNYTEAQLTMVASLIDYIVAQGVAIITYKDGHEIYKNLLDIGNRPTLPHFLIGANGKIKSTFGGLQVISKTGITVDTLWSGFDKGKVSITYFNAADPLQFPLTKAGVLITVNPSISADWCYQEWHPLSYKTIFTRWAKSDGTWDNWDVLMTTKNHTPSSLADGVGENGPTVTVAGAAIGDVVLISAMYDLQGVMCYGWVSAADTVKFRLQNETGAPVSLGAGTFVIKVIKR